MRQMIKKLDVVLVDFGHDIIGSEQGGIRPALIVQNDDGNQHSSTTIVIPFTKNIHRNPYQPTHTLFKKEKGNGLMVDSMLLGECIRQISEKRIIKYLGKITNEIDKQNVTKVLHANFDI